MGDRVILKAKKSGFTVELDYAETALEARQRRLLNRMVLTPEIDLKDFSCRAVVDWVDMLLLTDKATQWIWIQREIENAIGRKCHIQGRQSEDAGDYREFRIRFQEPQFRELQAAETAIDRRWGLREPAAVENLEISVDFSPRTSSDDLLARMYGVLVRSHHPGRDVISEPRDRPRFAWGDGPENTAHVLPLSKAKGVSDNDLLASVDKDQPAAVDATYYVGARGSRSAWRIMIKLVDRQHKASGTLVNLPENERRVRIEVTLDRNELHTLGIDTLEDLKAFKFQTFQGEYFQFRLPTFVDTSSLSAGPRSAITAHWETRRRTKFLNAGVVGLMAMEQAREASMKQKRQVMRQTLANGGKLRPSQRVGKGSSGTLVAYKDVTDSVLMALRHLGESFQPIARRLNGRRR